MPKDMHSKRARGYLPEFASPREIRAYNCGAAHIHMRSTESTTQTAPQHVPRQPLSPPGNRRQRASSYRSALPIKLSKAEIQQKAGILKSLPSGRPTDPQIRLITAKREPGRRDHTKMSQRTHGRLLDQNRPRNPSGRSQGKDGSHEVAKGSYGIVASDTVDPTHRRPVTTSRNTARVTSPTRLRQDATEQTSRLSR